MLSQLTIKDIVLIDQLTLALGDGLCVLTGETGAGKSIILDALGLALGARGDGALVRPGVAQGSVTALFETSDHPVLEDLLQGNDLNATDGLLLRRMQGADGRTKAFINDQPVSVQLLRQVGAALVEIHGQHDERALLDQDAHRDLLDAFAGVQDDVVSVGEAWRLWRESLDALKAHEAALEKSRTDEDYLRHGVQELETLNVEPGEEDKLAETRQLMMHAEKFSADLSEAYDALAGDSVADARLNAALRKLERNRDKAAGRFDTAIAALERAIMELGEARSAVSQALNDVEYDPQTLELSEERLFALRAAGRKYNVNADDLPGVAADMADKLAAIDHDENKLANLKVRVEVCEADYAQLARHLSEKRQNAAAMLDQQVLAELPPLKLEKAVFLTAVSALEEGGPAGFDQVEFKIAANPGQTPAPMMKVASGGELARFILGLKVVLAECGSAPVLVFDEIDTGAGGAVADAIGRRLADLGQKLQVIAVTHSPQVAALAQNHWRISKRADLSGDEERALTEVHLLDPTAREEEVARMLSGATITEEARAAAGKLIGGQA